MLIIIQNSECKSYSTVELYKLDVMKINKAVILLLRTVEIDEAFNQLT